MTFVELLLTDDQALKTRLALDLILGDPERYVMTDEERADYQRLAVFFGLAAAEPARFAPSGHLARTVKTLRRRARGPAVPESRSKRRTKRSQGRQKRDRQARREYAAAYNAARERYEQDMRDAEAAQQELTDRFQNEPLFTVNDINGNVMLSGIPKSMIVPMEVEDGPLVPTVLLPPGVEA